MEHLISLSEAPECTTASVEEVRGEPTAVERALNLGLAPGTRIKVMLNRRGLLGYPVVVRIGERTLAISRWVSGFVKVRIITRRGDSHECLGDEGEEEKPQSGVG